MSSKDIRSLLKAAEAQGCIVRKTRNSHWSIRRGDAIVVVSGTNHGGRGATNVKGDLRRYLGLKL